MKELQFIDYIAKKFRTKRPVVKGIGDDCAVVDYTRDRYLLFTCDMIIEGTHFTRKTAPFQVGWKAVAVNISDIASMGGVPKYALISAGIPPSRNIAFLREITRGIDAICRRFNIQVIGGDTNKSKSTVLGVTLIGEVEKRCIVRRDSARVGDLIFVTGVLGEGRFSHLNFLPRLKESRILARDFRISSMIDLSDGLAVDLCRLVRASSVGARIYKSLIPLSERGGDVLSAISQGEDFELLFTASKGESKRIIRRIGEKRDLPVTLIGEIIRERGIWLVEEEGKKTLLQPKGYAHM